MARLRVRRQVQHVHLVGDQPVVGERHQAPAPLAHDVDVGPVARHLLEEDLADQGDRNESRSISMTASRSAGAHRLDRERLGGLAERHQSADPSTIGRAVRRHAPHTGLEDRGPQRPRALRPSRPTPGSAPRRPERSCRLRSRAGPRSVADSLSTLVKTTCAGTLIGAQPFVELPLLVVDPAARVDQHGEQRQRRPPARVALDQRLPGVALVARDLGVAVARQVDEAQRPIGAPRPSRSSNNTMPRVRPGVFEVRASASPAGQPVEQRRLADVRAPGEGDLGRPGGGRPRRSRASARKAASVTSGIVDWHGF